MPVDVWDVFDQSLSQPRAVEFVCADSHWLELRCPCSCMSSAVYLLQQGGLAAGRYLLSLVTGPAWPRLRHVACISPATKPGARRGAWNGFGSSLGLLLVGTLLLLSVNDKTASRLGAIAATALLIWQLGSILMSHAQRRSAS